MGGGIGWYTPPRHIKGCWVNGGPVPTHRCPRCRMPEPVSVMKYYSTLMKADRQSRR